MIKSILYVGRVVRVPFLVFTTWCARRMRILGRTIIKPPLILVYSFFLATKLKSKKTLPPGNPFVVLSTRHSMIHGVIALITLFAATSTLQAQHNLFDTPRGKDNQPLLFALFPSPYEEEGAPRNMSAHLEAGEEVSLEELLALPPPEEEGVGTIEEITLEEEALTATPTITTTIGQPRREIISYTIQQGDTISHIAEVFGISVATILWENNLTTRDVLKIGGTLRILPVSGISHKVQKNDTLQRIADRYGSSVERIRTFNQLQDDALQISTIVVVPDGKKPTITLVKKQPTSSPSGVALRSGEKMVWPAAGHRITQYFSLRHPGIDIAVGMRTPHYAVLPGKVIFSGWMKGYGTSLLIDHGQGLVTRYAHHSKNLVTVGDYVEKGQVIALQGSTGRSTGPHLHFEVIVGKKRVNPFVYFR